MTDNKEFYKRIERDSEANNLLLDYFLPDYRKGYIEIDNKYVLPDGYLKYKEKLDNFQIRNDDILVVSHPKTGTTWVQEMVWMIENNLDFEAGKINIDIRFPFLEVSSLFELNYIIKEEMDDEKLESIKFVINSVEYVNELNNPRFIKTHLPWSLLPNQIKNNEKQPKMIYVARNPKDTCVSYYHHCRVFEGYTGSFKDFTTLFLHDRVSFGPFWKHVLGFWEQRDKENVLFITFEDMKKDLPSIIRKVADFLRKKLTNEQIDILTKHLSFESMKANPSVNKEFFRNSENDKKIAENSGIFMRSGKIGGHKSDMTPEIIAKFDAWTKTNLEGLHFDYPDLIS